MIPNSSPWLTSKLIPCKAVTGAFLVPYFLMILLTVTAIIEESF
jgi:hypothetical protein